MTGDRQDVATPGLVTTTVEFVHVRDVSVPPLQLAPLDTLALERLVHGDAADAVEHARGLAEALAGPRADDVRRRMLAKALAGERTLASLLEGILASRIAKGDLRSIGLLSSALESTVRRFERLAAAHRADVQGERRPVMLSVGTLNIERGE